MRLLDRGIVWTWISLIVVLLDQWTKAIASNSLKLYEAEPVTGFLNWTLMHNRGVAFSILADQPGWQRWFISIVASIVVVWLLVWLFKNRRNQKLLNISLVLIIGGAIGNIWDRIQLGYVVDFIEVYYQDFFWPAFNIADSAITVGAVLLIIDAFVNKNENSTG
ncbi:signal peptidase II [Marinicella sp. W31]|uniref:signal peptidase II n=1 Tax=Marinicella sp. W31 TaxID=3023713 RepID=UPI0037580D86